MKKLLLSAATIAAMTFACQHDKSEQVTPPVSNLSADEMQTASSIGRLVSSSEAFAQAEAHQKANPTTTFAVAFSRTSIETILKQPHTVGLRAHYVKDSKGKLSLTLVGINKDLNNLYTAGALFSEGHTCPQHCAGTETNGGRLLTIDAAGQLVSVDKVKQQIAFFQAENPNQARSVAFGSKVLTEMLNQKGSVGIRFYFIKDEDGNRNLMFVGTDKNLNDLRIYTSNARDGGGKAGGGGPICPPECRN